MSSVEATRPRRSVRGTLRSSQNLLATWTLAVDPRVRILSVALVAEFCEPDFPLSMVRHLPSRCSSANLSIGSSVDGSLHETIGNFSQSLFPHDFYLLRRRRTFCNKLVDVAFGSFKGGAQRDRSTDNSFTENT